MAIFGLATILFADVLQRWFRVWQQKEIILSNMDDDDIHHNGSDECNIANINKNPTCYSSHTLGKVRITHANDENFEYKI